jgi:hypothetical protein
MSRAGVSYLHRGKAMRWRQERKWAALARPPISPADPAVFGGSLVLRQQGGRMLGRVVQTTRQRGQIR